MNIGSYIVTNVSQSSDMWIIAKMCARGRRVYGNSVLSSQFFWKSKTILSKSTKKKLRALTFLTKGKRKDTRDQTTESHGWILSVQCYLKEAIEKTTYCMIPIIWHSRKGKTIESVNRSKTRKFRETVTEIWSLVNISILVH